MLKSMEIVVHSKKSLFQQKFQKKLYKFNRNSKFRSVESDSDSDSTQKPPTRYDSDSDSATPLITALCSGAKHHSNSVGAISVCGLC